MKHNPLVNEKVAADPHFAHCHPYWPERYLAAHRRVMKELARDLAEVSGFEHVCLQPAAGAHGELAAVLMMRAYFDHRGEQDRRIILIPDTAHGTNPASAAMAGFECVPDRERPRGDAAQGGRPSAPRPEDRRDHGHEPEHARGLREGLHRDRRRRAQGGRPRLHGRRQLQRDHGHLPAREDRRRRHALQPAQDVHDAARRRRTRIGPDRLQRARSRRSRRTAASPSRSAP